MKTSSITLTLNGEETTLDVEPRYDVQYLDVSDDRVLSFGGLAHDLLGYQVYRLRGWLGRRQ